MPSRIRQPLMTSVIVHYQELALKGRNRPWFVRMLVRAIRTALADLSVRHVRPLMGRIEVCLESDDDWPVARARLSGLPGIGNFAGAVHVAPDLDAMGDAIVASAAGRPPATFRIAARRADKRFPVASPDIERVIGRRVQDATGWPVDLSHPQRKIYVEVLTRDAFFYFDKEPGPGGLPTGTSGKVLVLISGGIDSPVAAWRMIRRGCRAYFVHFHSYPVLARTSQDKVRQLVERLTTHQLRSRLFLVPFASVQQQVVLSVPPALRVVIYRRLMLRIAEGLAARTGSQALVTGDVIGQVASQTIENLAVIERAATLPILRPLVGFDKEEITREAQALGTYDVSIVPDQDCCTLFTPAFPATRASLAVVERAERALDIDRLVTDAAAEAVIEDFKFPDGKIGPRRASAAIQGEQS
jgi:thiamine biosynthesis protein ThiI